MSSKSVIIFGLGKFGSSVAAELDRKGAEVLVIDQDHERVQSFAHDHPNVEIKECDIRDNAVLDTLGVSNMDAVVIAITENIDASIITTMYAKESGVPFILAKAKDETHSRILKKLGADRVIIPEQSTGLHAAHQILTESVIDFIELSSEIRMVEIAPRPEWVGKNLKELNLRKTEHVNVIAVRTPSELIVNVDPEMILSDRYTILLTVADKDVTHLLR